MTRYVIATLASSRRTFSASLLHAAITADLNAQKLYLREEPLYLVGLLLITIGICILLVRVMLRVGPGMAEVVREQLRRLRSRQPSRGRYDTRRPPEQIQNASGDHRDAATSRSTRRQVRRRSTPLRTSQTPRLAFLFARFRDRADPESVRKDRLPAPSPELVLERVRQLADGTGEHASSKSHIPARRVRREIVHLTRKYEVALQSREIPRAVENYQMVWALRLLSDALENRSAPAADVLAHWLAAVEDYMRNGSETGIGPSNPDFIWLMRARDR